jgi:hypothetical protein
MRTFIDYLPLILLVSVALFSGATVISVIIAFRAIREHHNTIFPIVREVEAVKAWRARIAVIIFLLLTGITAGAWVATQRNPETMLVAAAAVERSTRPQILAPKPLSTVMDNSEDASALTNVVVEDISVPTEEQASSVATTPPAVVNVLDASTNHPESSPSQPEVVLATSTPTLGAVAASPVSESAVTLKSGEGAPALALQAEESVSNFLPGDVKIGPISFATRIDDRHEAINPSSVFDVTAEKIYAVFPYEGMKNGLLMSVIWYYQGRELLRDEYEWRWGSTDRSYAFVRPHGTGDYKVEIKIGSETMASGEFTVRR